MEFNAREYNRGMKGIGLYSQRDRARRMLDTLKNTFFGENAENIIDTLSHQIFTGRMDVSLVVKMTGMKGSEMKKFIGKITGKTGNEISDSIYGSL